MGGAGFLDVTVDAQDHTRAFALELDRFTAGAFDLALGVEAAEHPADRRRLVRRAGRVDRAGDDQPIDRTGHGDVVETQPLRALLLLARFLHGVVRVGAARLARDRVGHPETEAAVGERKDLV